VEAHYSIREADRITFSGERKTSEGNGAHDISSPGPLKTELLRAVPWEHVIWAPLSHLNVTPRLPPPTPATQPLSGRDGEPSLRVVL